MKFTAITNHPAPLQKQAKSYDNFRVRIWGVGFVLKECMQLKLSFQEANRGPVKRRIWAEEVLLLGGLGSQIPKFILRSLSRLSKSASSQSFLLFCQPFIISF